MQEREMNMHNDPFTTREQAEAIQAHIQQNYPHVTTILQQDLFEPYHWFIDVEWPNHSKVVIRSKQSWQDREYLFA